MSIATRAFDKSKSVIKNIISNKDDLNSSFHSTQWFKEKPSEVNINNNSSQDHISWEDTGSNYSLESSENERSSNSSGTLSKIIEAVQKTLKTKSIKDLFKYPEGDLDNLSSSDVNSSLGNLPSSNVSTLDAEAANTNLRKDVNSSFSSKVKDIFAKTISKAKSFFSEQGKDLSAESGDGCQKDALAIVKIDTTKKTEDRPRVVYSDEYDLETVFVEREAGNISLEKGVVEHKEPVLPKPYVSERYSVDSEKAFDSSASLNSYISEVNKEANTTFYNDKHLMREEKDGSRFADRVIQQRQQTEQSQLERTL